MDYLLLDTCIVLHLLRTNEYSEKCRQAIKIFSNHPLLVLSAVTKGELTSLQWQQKWNPKKWLAFQGLEKNITYIDIVNTDEQLINNYAQIDAYSKRKTPDSKGNLLEGAARTMHKNDLWIAATAYALDIPLMTTDGDFDHLNGVFLNVMKIV